MKYILLLLLMLPFVSCRYEETTESEFIILNQSGVTIKIAPTATLIETLILLNEEFKQFDMGVGRGLSTGINLAFFADGDPVTLIFNDSDTVIHYRDNLVHEGNFLNESSDRNFYNPSSYEKEIKELTKYTQQVTLNYTFTEQDYLAAKQ